MPTAVKNRAWLMEPDSACFSYLHRWRALPASHIKLLYALLEATKEVACAQPQMYVHFFGDGHDAASRSAAGYCADLLEAN
ncbi:hypothetical protein FB451DRAFT_1387011 [Mycena latifolia]|nr:hypothetical protein FB451DRAFT_1387011 [Mycena latifolia]